MSRLECVNVTSSPLELSTILGRDTLLVVRLCIMWPKRVHSSSPWRSKPNKGEMKIREVFKGTLCQNLVIRMLRITNVESESLKLGQKYQK